MNRQDQDNLAAAFHTRFQTLPDRSTVHDWMRQVRWILDLSPGGMNKAYKILDREIRQRFGVAWL